jgi:hypothetical protein
MADKDRLFVTNAITRAGIAENLNSFLDSNQALTDDKLAEDDDRLTDEICME